jgi:hypothetical protein
MFVGFFRVRVVAACQLCLKVAEVRGGIIMGRWNRGNHRR